MRMTRLLTQTLREAPAGAELAGQRLLLRAGYIQQMAAGLYSSLPLARVALDRLQQLAAHELALSAALEIQLPLVQPIELSANNATAFADLSGRSLSLAGDPFPALLTILRGHIRSYRQLPLRLRALGPSWRDHPRPRAGWLQDRLDETLSTFDLCSSSEALAEAEKDLKTRMDALLSRLELPVLHLEALPASGAQAASTWLFSYPEGEQSALVCAGCGYAATAGAARFARPSPPVEQPLPVERVATPHCPTIDSLARFLGLPATRTAKVVFLVAHDQLFFVILRGDREVNEDRLKALLGVDHLRPARDEEILAAGAVPGYASAVGLPADNVIVDLEIPNLPNLVAGANEAGYHLLNVNYGRDYTAARVADIAQARAGDTCPDCGQPLREEHGSAIGRLDAYTALPECTFLDEGGKARPLQLAHARLHLHRLLAALAEAHHEERGLCWPAPVAPFLVHIVLLASKTGAPEALADELYARLSALHVPTLLDDRPESAGVKFADADLIGLPLRLTVSERALKQGGIEARRRNESESRILPLEEALAWAEALLKG